jgi:2-oxoisovalerate dehydrogenase E1 component
VVLRGCIGIGNSSATHHSGSYYPLYVHFPGFRVVVPSTPGDAKGLFKTALRGNDPVMFLEHKSLLATKGPVPEGEHLLPFGEARVAREGKDVTVVAIALMVQKTLKACAELEKDGISVEVIDPRTLAPLDMGAILRSLEKTGRLLVVDETFGPCGLGAEIAARVMEEAFDDLDAPVRRLNGAHAPTPYSPPLEGAVAPQVGDIAKAVRELLAE